MWCFLINYALSLCLFILAEQETSNFISILYSFVAMTLYYKAVLTKPLAELLSSKNMIAFNTLQFLSGIRIALICKNLIYSYLQGVVMMTVAIIRNYRSRAKHFSFFFAAFSLLVAFLMFSICVKSPLMFIIGVVFLCWMLASELFPVNKMYVVVALMALAAIGLVAFDLNFTLLFETIEQSLQQTEGFGKLIVLMKDPDILIPEKKLLVAGLGRLKSSLLGLQQLVSS